MEKIANKRAAVRAIFFLLLAVPLVFFKNFYEHFYVYMSGSIISDVIRNEWHIVLISIFVSIAFFLLTFARRKVRWAEYGLVGAFFVSLFVEMYGVPLTIIFASKYFFQPGLLLPENVLEFYFLGVGFGADMAMTYGIALISIGMFLIVWGWVDLYRSAKKNIMATKGAYGFSRHPQYLGFMLIILGWFFGWPTLLTVVFTPILMYKYIKLCAVEEAEIAKEFPQEEEYKKTVPFLV